MNLKPLILVVLSMVSLSLFAQDTYYYYKGQRIPLTTDPTRVNVITLSSYSTQGGAAFMPAAVPTGIQVETVISGSIYNMSLLMTSAANVDLLNNYVNSTVNPNYNVILPCYTSREGFKLAISNIFYVKLRQSTDISILRNMASTYNLTIVRQNQFMPLWYTMSITQQTPLKTLEMVNHLYETGAFAAVEPDFMSNWMENISWDENVSEQWGLYNAENDSIDINASSAWNYATGRGVKVAVIDTGVEHTHDDLRDNMSPLYYDTETGTNTRVAYSDHGTHVAGIIGATRNNGTYITGVAPDVEIVQVASRLLGGESNVEKRANGINWAARNGVEIINCSWKCMPLEQILDAIDYAIDYGRNGKGCIVVKSAGNTAGGAEEDADSISYPGSYRSEMLVVGSIQKDGIRSSSSCYGTALDVVAPGVDILSTVRYNKIQSLSGTSMAAPHVSGIVALILELNPDLTAQQVRDIIEQSTIKVGLRAEEGEYETHSNRPNGTWNKYYGYGLVDALKAVQNTPRKEIDY